ncbi:MAG: hypothetical protein LLF90_10645 [Methanomicrobiaceae archaeon]|uniref:hypothetical protein n=1 Tax=Methanoculleus sp. TaxID=90427 RepID=UPI00320FF0F8|nr:hypothetical protein [Methanomicrobiaceae archaeon]
MAPIKRRFREAPGRPVVPPWFGRVSRQAIRAALQQASAALWFRYGLPEVFDGCQKSKELFYGESLARLSQ